MSPEPTGKRLAGRARRLLRALEGDSPRNSADVQATARELEQVLDEWDKQGNPANLDAAGLRAVYVSGLNVYLDSSAQMNIAAFDNTDLSMQAIQIRSAVLEHLARCTKEWYGAETSLGA